MNKLQLMLTGLLAVAMLGCQSSSEGGDVDAVAPIPDQTWVAIYPCTLRGTPTNTAWLQTSNGARDIRACSESAGVTRKGTIIPQGGQGQYKIDWTRPAFVATASYPWANFGSKGDVLQIGTADQSECYVKATSAPSSNCKL